MTWQETALGECFTIKHGLAFKSQHFGDSGDHVVLTPGNFHEQGGFRSRPGKERFYAIAPPDDFVLRPGDLVIAMTEQGEGLLGSSALIPKEGSYLHNQRIGLIQNLDERKMNKIFLYRLFNTPHVREQVRASASGTKVRHTAPKRIYTIKVRIPPVAIQRKISDILSAYDDLIENNRRRIALLEESARLLYREWFVRFRFPGYEHAKIVDGLPEGWKRRTLGDLVGVVKQQVKPSDFEEFDIHIGLEHIPRRSFTLAAWEPADGLASGKWRFEEGDILFCKIRPYFHKVGFTVRRGLVSSDALVWRVHDEADWPIVLCATSSDHFVAVASKTMREGSKMPRADWKVLQEYVIPEPLGELLDDFNETVRRIAAQCRTLALQNRTLAKARDLLLPRLMNGEIAV